MSYNLKDVERGTKQLLDSVETALERKSQAQADAFVDRISRTRGLWVFPHIGALASIFVSVATFTGVVFKASGWVPYALGAAAAAMWWSSSFTKRHPFWSFVLGGLIAPIALLSIAHG